ncbi:MAG TPA: DNA polymerase Y family protein [Chitinophagaceae bacterium]|nr:DNA polymerase Y family protein [Chitinophagaceae bacterium]
MKRFVVIWFRFLKTDWLARRIAAGAHLPLDPKLPTAFVISEQNRILITELNSTAIRQGLSRGMPLADARVLVPEIQQYPDSPRLAENLLRRLGEYCLRFSPTISIATPDSLILDATGCAHLWNGEKNYLATIVERISQLGYQVKAAFGDTIGAAWALAHYDAKQNDPPSAVLPDLPVAALRIDPEILEKLHKLGLRRVGQLLPMPRHALRRRFGESLLLRIDQLLGRSEELAEPIHAPAPCTERLPCLEPISTATGITIALKQLLGVVCTRLQKEGKGLRQAQFKYYRVDGKSGEITITTTRPVSDPSHLLKLFELKMEMIEPGLGIELFVLDAFRLEELHSRQEKFWDSVSGLHDQRLSSLLDRVSNKLGSGHIFRYLPSEHHWPERSVKRAASLAEQPAAQWPTDRLRPIRLLPRPEPIDVTAPIPDYPPMNFRYKNILHTIRKADGPERIEPEWWLEEGPHRDYYSVEDEEGNRYWLFRLGHYHDKNCKWFLHGFFA